MFDRYGIMTYISYEAWFHLWYRYFYVFVISHFLFFVEIACLATMLRLGFKRRAAWEQTPPLRLRQNFLGYCTALFWFVAVMLTWLNLCAVMMLYTSNYASFFRQINGSVLFLLLASWVAWKSCRMTYELALALCRHQRQYGYATLAGWLSIAPGVNFLIWLILLVRLCSMELPRGFRRWIAIAIALMLLTPGLGLVLLPWTFVGCFLAIGAFVAGVLARGVVYARPGVVAPFTADCRRRFIRWIIPAAALIGMALASWVAFSIYTHWCFVRARIDLAAQGISVEDNKAPVVNDAYPVYQELAASWQSAYGFHFDSRLVVQKGFYYLKELPAEVKNALTGILDRHAETVRLLDGRLIPNQSLRLTARHPWKAASGCSILSKLLQLERFRLLRAKQSGDTEEIRHIWQQMETLHYWLVDNALTPAKFDYAGKWTWQMAHEPIMNQWHFSDQVLQEQLEATARMEAHLIQKWKDMWARQAMRICSGIEEKLPADLQSFRPLLRHETAITEAFPYRETARLFQARQLRYLMELAKSQEQYPDLKPEQDLDKSLFYVFFTDFIHDKWSDNSYFFIQQLAVLRVRYGALGAELYHRKYGRWPEQWSDLVPEFIDAVPLDPFTLKPLEIQHGELIYDEYTALPEESAYQSAPQPASNPNQSCDPKSDFDADETVEIPRPSIPSIPRFLLILRTNQRHGFRISSRGKYIDREYPYSAKRNYDITFSWYR